MKKIILIFGLLLLTLLEISKVYFIMPFPGSQHNNTINLAYFINNNIWWLRILLIAFFILPFIYYMKNGRLWQKILLLLGTALYLFIAYEVNFKMLADHMFYQPKQKLFLNAEADTTSRAKLVLGISIGNEAKAFPIEIIGYHHQVKDTIGGVPVMVTYCTVCRTGRVYSPYVNEKPEQFRLVGMDHFNAMFEDATTKSWWRQESGEAIVGPLKGAQLKEIPSAQMTLQDWLILHPNSLILQKDTSFRAEYDDLKNYDAGTISGSLEHHDTASWKLKSWVIGVSINNEAKAYDWNELRNKTVIEDSINNTNILLTILPNGKTFFVFNRSLNGQTLHFSFDPVNKILQDAETDSQWTLNGTCTAGTLQGKQLQTIQSYQEFWHSWQSFHPQTKTYDP